MTTLEEYPKINSFLGRVCDDLEELLSVNLVGIYVWGSLATNSYNDGLSDIDTLIILHKDINDEMLSKLSSWASVLIKEEEIAEKFDAVFVTLQNLNNGDGTSSQGGIEFWQGTLQKTKNCLGDNPLVLDMIRQTGLCLYGPSPKEIISPVSRDRLVNSLNKELRDLQSGLQKNFDDFGWRYYAITTLCRILYTSKTNKYLSKKKALIWYEQTYNLRQSLIHSALSYCEGDSSSIKTISPQDLLSFMTDVETII